MDITNDVVLAGTGTGVVFKGAAALPMVTLPVNLGEAATLSELLAKGGNSPLVLDLFGGKSSQIPGAINVDIIAEQGVRASATKLPFGTAAVDKVITSNPYIPKAAGGVGDIMEWLPESARVLKPGGQIIINATASNPYAKLPSVQTLESLGLRVVQEPGPLLPQFQNQVFRYTDGGPITRQIQSTILEKVR
jgi:filamentous hemagglutinin